jgi:hypothetical protein
LLPNEIFIVWNEGQTCEGLKNQKEALKDVYYGIYMERDKQIKRESSMEMILSHIWNLVPAYSKMVSQDAYGLGFRHSLYVWKDNNETIPMLLNSLPNSTEVSRNLTNKSNERF